MLLQGSTKGIKLIARTLVEAEITDGNALMKAQEDGTWKLVRSGEYTAEKETEDKELALAAAKGVVKEEKKEVLQATRVPSGG